MFLIWSYVLYFRYDVDCKKEYAPFKLFKTAEIIKNISQKRQPKYLSNGKSGENTYVIGEREYKNYEQYTKSTRKPGSCYLCCVPYSRPPNYVTTTRPRPSPVWTPRPTRYKDCFRNDLWDLLKIICFFISMIPQRIQCIVFKNL